MEGAYCVLFLHLKFEPFFDQKKKKKFEPFPPATKDFVDKKPSNSAS